MHRDPGRGLAPVAPPLVQCNVRTASSGCGVFAVENLVEKQTVTAA